MQAEPPDPGNSGASTCRENYIAGKVKEWDEYRTRVSSWECDKYMINY